MTHKPPRPRKPTMPHTSSPTLCVLPCLPIARERITISDPLTIGTLCASQSDMIESVPTHRLCDLATLAVVLVFAFALAVL